MSVDRYLGPSVEAWREPEGRQVTAHDVDWADLPDDLKAEILASHGAEVVAADETYYDAEQYGQPGGVMEVSLDSVMDQQDYDDQGYSVRDRFTGIKDMLREHTPAVPDQVKH